VAELVVVPITTSIAAGTAIDISALVRGNIRTLTSAYKFVGSDGTVAAAHSTLTVVTVAPAAGQIQLSDKKEVTCGDALDAKASLILLVEYEHEFPRIE